MNHCAYCENEDSCKNSTTHQWCSSYTQRRAMEPQRLEEKPKPAVPIGAITIPEHRASKEDYFDTEKIVLPESGESVWDTQVGGAHYKSFAIQPTEYCIKNNLGFAEGCVIKYVTRHALKNGKEDIEKAIHYLQMILEEKY